MWVAVLVALDHCHTWSPSRKTSVSFTESMTAMRCLVGPAYQTRAVCEPVSKSASDPVLDAPPILGSSGKPRSERWTTVP